MTEERPADARIDSWVLEQSGLDFIPDLTCEVVHGRSWATAVPCTAAAAWIAICDSCGASVLYCDADRRQLDLSFAEGSIVNCTGCNTKSSISHPRHHFVPVKP